MKKFYKLIVLSVAAIIIALFPFIFPILHDSHAIIIALHFLFVIILAFINYKYLFAGTSILIISHLIADLIELKAIPATALINSFFLLLLTILLYINITSQFLTSLRTKNIIYASQVGTWEWDVAKDEIIYNERWAEMLGYTLAELAPITPLTMRKLAHPEDLILSDAGIEAIIKKEIEYYNVDIRFLHKNGHYVWVNDRGKVVKWSKDGKPLVIVGTHTDITKQKNLEAEIIQSLKNTNYIIEHAQQGIAVLDNDSRFVYVSKKFLSQFGITDYNVTKKHLYDIFPDAPQKWRIVHERVLKGETLSANTDLYLTEKKQKYWTRWECRPWFINDDEIGGIIIYMEVINDLIDTYHALRDSQNRLQAIMDHSPIGFAVVNLANGFDITYMNDNFSHILGLSASELEKPGKFWDTVFINEEVRTKMKNRILSDLKIGGSLPFSWLNIPIEKKDLPPIYISIYASIFGKEQTVVVTIVDVTEQNAFQQELDYRAKYDVSTDVYNREHFSKRLMNMDISDNYPLGLLLVDIDGLKLINDAFGIEKGNEAIKELAQLIKKTISDANMIGRLGGDDFAVALPRTSQEIIDETITKLKKNAQAIKIGKTSLTVTIGSFIKYNNEIDTLSLFKAAEDNMYKRKLITRKSTRNHAIEAILKTLTQKYEQEKIHSDRVSRYCKGIGTILKMRSSDIEDLQIAGQFHDIGKITIPDNILHKPSKLTQQEYEVIKNHSKAGYDILRETDSYAAFAEAVLHHHEHYDGSGYPQGLKGEEIPLNARIIAVADAYEAMTSTRPYRQAMSQEEAIEELKKYSGTQFDPKIVNAFLKYLETKQ